MTRDNVPAPAQLPTPRQPAGGACLTAAISQGAVQGAVRSITARLVDKFLTNPPDWLRVLWHALPRPWE
ncbi:hypothetical protein [Streptomyces minutiscleroticus]|uniref:Uncharacterized protein n=1 Tax=Streptomyces minutiscleroticus TaxID=68238 RepID=A0A918P0S8_9ACTN|nr:hypothetical protein [Streptomyces minutiscleroticus]GGY12014.1 hypothetical protein GCM10010358_75540 [Streptomyces minutiscleroticus]